MRWHASAAPAGRPSRALANTAQRLMVRWSGALGCLRTTARGPGTSSSTQQAPADSRSAPAHRSWAIMFQYIGQFRTVLFVSRCLPEQFTVIVHACCTPHDSHPRRRSGHTARPLEKVKSVQSMCCSVLPTLTIVASKAPASSASQWALAVMSCTARAGVGLGSEWPSGALFLSGWDAIHSRPLLRQRTLC